MVYMFVCLLNSSLQSLNCYSNIVNNKDYFIQLITAIIWLIAAFVTYFGVIKKNKQIIKQNREYCNEELKIIDYPKWIKTQRTKKLQKIKRVYFLNRLFFYFINFLTASVTFLGNIDLEQIKSCFLGQNNQLKGLNVTLESFQQPLQTLELYILMILDLNSFHGLVKPLIITTGVPTAQDNHAEARTYCYHHISMFNINDSFV